MIQGWDYNFLPYGGEVFYLGRIFSEQESSDYFKNLYRDIAWENDQAIIYGKRISTKRKVAWYAEQEFSYTYSKVTKKAVIWSDLLLEIKKRVEESSRTRFNSCLLNLYHDGSEGMAWHSDGEKDLKRHGSIASITFGAERKFFFKHKETKEKVSIDLEHGSLLIMRGETQDNWLHRLPPTKKVNEPRINLTFRIIENQ